MVKNNYVYLLKYCIQVQVKLLSISILWYLYTVVLLNYFFVIQNVHFTPNKIQFSQISV